MILWDEQSITTLNEIVTYLKRSKLGVILELIANFYIDRHDVLQIDNYAMGFCPGYIIDSSLISDGEYKLAFMCELFELKSNEYLPINKKINSKVIYKYFSKMIKYGFDNGFVIKMKNLNYREIYITSLIKNIIIPNNGRNNTNSYVKHGLNIKLRKDKISEIIKFSYFIVKQIISNNNFQIFNLQSLITETENLDLRILTQNQIKSILDVLNTKRKLYLKIFLVLTYKLIKDEYYNKDAFIKRIVFHNQKEFINVLVNPVTEIMLLIIVINISKRNII